MPQLMPLNWVISSILVLLIIIASCLLYSENMFINEVGHDEKGVITMNMKWCW